KACERNVNAGKKFLVVQHLDSEKHKAAAAKRTSSGRSSTALLPTYIQASGKQSQFLLDLCNAFVSNGIRLYKLENLTLRQFLEKYTKMDIPGESSLRKRYVDILYNRSIEYIRESIGNP